MQQNDTTEQQIELLTIQLIAAMGFLLTVVISIILTYDKILSLSDQPRLFSDEYARKLSYFNSVLIIIVVLIYLYVGYGNIQIAKKEEMCKHLFFIGRMLFEKQANNIRPSKL